MRACRYGHRTRQCAVVAAVRINLDVRHGSPSSSLQARHLFANTIPKCFLYFRFHQFFFFFYLIKIFQKSRTRYNNLYTGIHVDAAYYYTGVHISRASEHGRTVGGAKTFYTRFFYSNLMRESVRILSDIPVFFSF